MKCGTDVDFRGFGYARDLDQQGLAEIEELVL
ncbi:hypothetical protein QG37_05022 [Candidozyma auris]|uniref:Uncharacterized protein n=1 Tax=Candidozyma auris TaxID=498019 RepID=A0A0L0NX71_CANAR|nr:hypothetical protein QG37_05022 [[Candida] auris]